MIKHTAKLTTASALALSCGLASGAVAQDQTWLDLGQITLLGSGFETSVMESPASVTVVDEDKLKKVAPQSVGELLRSIPGVIVDDSNFDRVRIRGEGGNRVAIKIDGQSLTDHTDYGTPVLVDPNDIERIEIVRGSSSVVSGSRAIGGVVNIITKRGGDKPFGGSFSAGYFSATEGYRTSLSLNGKQGAIDYKLFLGKSDIGDLHVPSTATFPSGIVQPTDIQDQSLSAHLGYTSGNHYWAVKYQDYDVGTNVFTGMPGMTIKLPQRDLTKVGLYYEGTDLTPWMSKLTASVFNQTVDREFEVSIPPFPGARITSASSDEQRVYGFNIDAVLEFAQGHRTKVGLEYENDFLDASKTTTSRIPVPFPPPGGIVNTVTVADNEARMKTSSLYVQHEADLTDNLTAFVGGRYYNVDTELEASAKTVNGAPVPGSPLNSGSDSRFLASAGVVWSPREELALRFNVSQGFNNPTLVQKYITTTAAGNIIYGNPNLVPETSTTAEIGARYDGGNTVVDGTLFYSDAKNYMETQLRPVPPGPPGPPQSDWVNIASAKTFGLELYAEHRFEQSNLTPYISATWMRRKYNSAYSNTTPNLFGKIGVIYDWELQNGISGSFDAYMQGESANNGGPGYATFNVAADVALNDKLNFTANFNNLFNKAYYPSANRTVPGAERSVNLNLNWKF